jgi:hypothetical protein
MEGELSVDEQAIVDEAIQSVVGDHEEVVLDTECPYPKSGFLKDDFQGMSHGNKWINGCIETYREYLREALGLDPKEEEGEEEDPLSLEELEILNKLQTHESWYIPRTFEDILEGEGLGLDAMESSPGELEVTEDPHRMSHLADAVSGIFDESTPESIWSAEPEV